MTEEEEIQLTLDVQKGMKDGDTIKYDQIADEAVGHIAGDLIFTIKQAPDDVFVRDGDDLKMNMVITLLDSLIGFRRTFRHLDDHEVVVEKSDISYCMQVITINGEGMPRKGGSGRGNLLITLYIDFPGELDQNQKSLIKQALQ
jgi:DnaJ family protein B protein 11